MPRILVDTDFEPSPRMYTESEATDQRVQYQEVFSEVSDDELAELLLMRDTAKRYREKLEEIERRSGINPC